MQDEELEDDCADHPRYQKSNEICEAHFRNALCSLPFLGDDLFMRMQALNLSIVDQFVMALESELLSELIEEERTPIPEATFVLAQSQMWIFALYELLRTWRQRVRNLVEWHEDGVLERKLRALEEDLGYPHGARELRADQIRKVMAAPSIVDRIRGDLRATHIQFARLAAVRISIAKHEVRGDSKSVALRPGYGRIIQWSGSLDFELENGLNSMGFISRRNIADEIRALADRGTPPDEQTLKDFDCFMRGPRAV